MNLIPIAKKDLRLLCRAYIYILPHKLRFFLTLLCMLLILGLDVIQPLLWGTILSAMYAREYTTAWSNIILVFFTLISNMLVSLLKNYLTEFLTQHIVVDMKKDLFRKIINLPVATFDNRKSGDFINRMVEDGYRVANSLTNDLLNGVIDLLKVLVIGVMVFKISVPLAFIVVGTLPISQVVFMVFGRLLRRKQERCSALGDTYYSFLNECILGIREIKSLGIKSSKFNEFLDLATRFKNLTIDTSFLRLSSYTFSQMANTASQLSVMAVGGYFIFKGMLTVKYFIAFNAYAGQFATSLINITRLNATVQQTLASLERIYEILDSPEERFGENSLNNVEGDITFRKVSFSYESDISTLSDISLEIGKNKITALVGSSGSGKTTVLNLLQKFYDHFEGEIYIDGINIKDLSEPALRRHIAVVRQDPFLFNRSILDNLWLANPDATEEEINKACITAYIHEFIMELPEKYQTLLGENSVNLSGGQKQRLAIARALLKGAKILVFDEATSALDNESQHFIKQAIAKISKDHTVIIVAHRLSTVIEANQIIILHEGKVVGQGTHPFLICQNEIYQRLYENEVGILNDNVEEVNTA